MTRKTIAQAFADRLAAMRHDAEPDVARLPPTLKRDYPIARIGMLQRLASTRHFVLGGKTGTLRSVENRSRRFRADVRQRVVVKAMVVKHLGRSVSGLASHVGYLTRLGGGPEGTRSKLFNALEDDVDGVAATKSWANDRHHFRLVISPEHGDRIVDLKGYVRDVMQRVGRDLRESELTWLAACHFDTEHPHAHVVFRGRRRANKDLVIPREYIAFGIRARAQEAAHERLGDLSRVEAERSIWRDTKADRFTGFDRRLLQASSDCIIAEFDGVGPWAALGRSRLRHLEALGLAAREDGHRYRLDAQLERKLRQLQLTQQALRAHWQLSISGQKKSLGLTEIDSVIARSLMRGTAKDQSLER